MEKQRRMARGMFCELFGEAAMPIDEFMRTVDMWGAVTESYAKETDP